MNGRQTLNNSKNVATRGIAPQREDGDSTQLRNLEGEKVSIHSPNLDIEEVNRIFRREGVEELKQEQYNLIESCYRGCLLETVNTYHSLDRHSSICDHNLYAHSKEFEEHIIGRAKTSIKRKEKIQSKIDAENPPADFKLDVEHYQSLHPITKEQRENLIPEAVKRPHKDGVNFAEYFQFVGEVNFEMLEPYEMRAIELIHCGVYSNNPDTAIIYALREKGISQDAEKLDKTNEEISDELSVVQKILPH